MQPLHRHPTEPAAEITVTGSVIPIRSNPNRMSKLNIPIDSSRRNSDTSHIFPTAVTAPRVFHVDHKAVEPCRPPLQRGNRTAPDTLLGLCRKGLRGAYHERGVHLGELAPRDGWAPSPGSSAQRLRRRGWAKGHETSTMYLSRPRETVSPADRLRDSTSRNPAARAAGGCADPSMPPTNTSTRFSAFERGP